jgi:excisionase family DNA binding protein
MPLLTVKDIATRLQVKEKTVYAWASQRRIPCVKIGSVLRFDEADIEQWLESCRVENRPPNPLRRKRRQHPVNNVDVLIERAKRADYTPTGETRPIASPFRKER